MHIKSVTRDKSVGRLNAGVTSDGLVSHGVSYLVFVEHLLHQLVD